MYYRKDKNQLPYLNTGSVKSSRDDIQTSLHQQPITAIGSLPAFGYVRLAQLVLDPNKPERPAVVPVSRATLWRWVKAGAFPSPVKLSDRVTAWRVDDIRTWILDHGT